MGMTSKKTIEDIDVKGKRVIVRVDFNVPQDEKGNITDDKRIKGAIPTISYLVEKKAKVILVSHLGRPKNGFESKYSMKPAAERLSSLMGKEVTMAQDVVGEDAKKKAAALKEGEILMLENVRFHKEEEKNDPAFAGELAGLAEIFVNDAFGTAHRAHASTAGIADYLPAVCGYLIQKEIQIMGSALSNPKRPFVAILGGAKVSDKIAVIENLIDKVDDLIIGGGMAYTFLKAKGYKIGKSLCEDDKIELAKSLMEKAEKKGVNLMLPIGSIVGKEFKNDTEYKYVPSDAMPDDWMGMDIGSLTVEKFARVIKKARTIVWNGPMGVFEFPNFAYGTREIAKVVANLNAVSIVGGGDSAAALEQLGYADMITHISTGGGAALEYLEGKVLPGIAALLDKNPRKKVFAGNWKMNKTPSEAVDFVEALKPVTGKCQGDIIIAVPYVCIPDVKKALADSAIGTAAQNMHWEDKGAYTGEISGPMLADLGVEYVIIGHSERRQYYNETDEDVCRKIKAAFRNGIIPIVCVGESLRQREEGVTSEVVGCQVKIALQGLDREEVESLILAYEPVWAIGTGVNATKQQANEVCLFIRDMIAKIYGEETASVTRILYGGSVTAGNYSDLFGMPDIDGGLIGGASLKLEDFSEIASFDA
ncbi:MAG: triose-phosphate isomerase [Eubacteriales bacterium]|nr:triose-phosphate isomerase [Eubacteriales bacterium]